MPRPTKQVKELRDKIDQQATQLAISGTTIAGLRRDLEGASRSITNLHSIITRVETESREHELAADNAQSRYHTLLRKHQQVCMMWAEMASQFDTVEVHKKEMSA